MDLKGHGVGGPDPAALCVCMHPPCCWAGLRPPCRASSVSPPVWPSSPSVWSSSSKLCGPPRHARGLVSAVLWSDNKHNLSAVRRQSVNPTWEFSSSHCTFLLLARSFDNLLFASLPLLSFSSDHPLASGCRFYIQLVTNTQEQEAPFLYFTLGHWRRKVKHYTRTHTSRQSLRPQGLICDIGSADRVSTDRTFMKYVLSFSS